MQAKKQFKVVKNEVPFNKDFSRFEDAFGELSVTVCRALIKARGGQSRWDEKRKNLHVVIGSTHDIYGIVEQPC